MARYSGQLELVSDGLIDTLVGIASIHALRIHQTVLRNVRTDPSLHALLVPGEEVELSLGRLFWWRWLLCVTTQGQSHRHGLFSFLFANTVHAIFSGAAVGVASALLISSHDTQYSVAVLAGLVFFALNFKAWLR